jgi:hypothetical protein
MTNETKLSLIFSIFGTILLLSSGAYSQIFFATEFLGLDLVLARIIGLIGVIVPTFFIWFGFYKFNKKRQ